MRALIGAIVLTLCALGCGLDKETADEPADVWWESDVEQRAADSNQGSDNEEEGKGDVEDCSEDLDLGLACEGDWMSTICVLEGLFWWCEDGVWLNESIKGK